MNVSPPLPAGLAERALAAGSLDPMDAGLLRFLARLSGREDDRAFAAVAACLLATVRAGGLRIPVEAGKLADRLAEFLRPLETDLIGPDGSPLHAWPGDAAELAARYAREFEAARIAGAYAALLGTPPAFVPLIIDRGGLYFQKHHAAEASVARNLAALIAAPDRADDDSRIRNAIDTVLNVSPVRSAMGGGAPLQADPSQRAALELAMRKRLAVISGGPGTGKTFLACNLLRAWVRARAAGKPAAPPPRIRLAAPTGRAAQRLADSLRRNLESVSHPAADHPEAAQDSALRGLAGETLHSLLRYHPVSGTFRHGPHRPLPADLVLVDEVSMVDIFLMSGLLEALEPDTCLVLLGDMDQLPSVEAGSVLADLMPDKGSGAGMGAHPLAENLALLDRGHRSGADILDSAGRINSMDGSGALLCLGAALEFPAPLPETGCRLLAPPAGKGYRAGWDDQLTEWAERQYLGYAGLVRDLCSASGPGDAAFLSRLPALFDRLEAARILTFTRKGWYGAEWANRRLRDRLAGSLDPSAGPEGPFAGMPVLILANDPDQNLYNGDVGVWLRVAGRALACFRRGEGNLILPAAFLPRHEPAFAMTVHKSQGSEFDRVLIALPEAGNRLLTKETLYTAVTRARRFAGIYGPEPVFLEAVGRKMRRESGLAEQMANLAILPP